MTRAAVPDALLGPLLDAAAAVLRDLDPAEVPPVLRALAGFDRRGLANATARQQLRRAFDIEDEFRSRVVEAFTGRPEVRAVLDAWDPEQAAEAAADAADRNDLAWWASALYAADPEGAEFGLGVACAEDRHRRAARGLIDDVRAAGVRIATAEEAQRRAETGQAELRAELQRIEGELREERRGRRDREADVERREAEAARAVREVEAALEKARREADLAEARARREADRARDAERRVRERARDAAAPAPPRPGPDPEALVAAARAARELTTRLESLARASRAAGSPAPTHPAPAGPTEPPEPPARRTPVPCPPGLRADQPEAVEAMLRTEGVVLLVDGYNVSMRGWPGTAVAQQRDQLVSALSRLHLRLRSHAIVVFDGADVEGVPPRRSPGVRVMFSPDGRAADPVIIEELRAMPARVPVMVASSDGWVRGEAERAGATVVTADALLAVLRR